MVDEASVKIVNAHMADFLWENVPCTHVLAHKRR